jgi:alcohol dehydrogenase class IV
VAARAALLYAAHLSGLVLVNARTCLHHAICHAIGSVTGVGHGDANAVMLPHAVAFNADAAACGARACRRRARRWPRCRVARARDPLAASRHRRAHPLARHRRAGRARWSASPPRRCASAASYYNPRQVADAAEVRALLDAAY